MAYRLAKIGPSLNWSVASRGDNHHIKRGYNPWNHVTMVKWMACYHVTHGSVDGMTMLQCSTNRWCHPRKHDDSRECTYFDKSVLNVQGANEI